MWYARKLDGTAFPPRLFGFNTDEPLPPYDIQGDGVDSLAVARRTAGAVHTFVSRDSTGSFGYDIPFGLSSDAAIIANYRTRGLGSIAVFRGMPYFFYAMFFTSSAFDGGGPLSQFSFGLRDDYVFDSDGRAKRR
jgi:hypothetical protein